MNGEWLRLGVGGVVPISWDLTSKADDGPGELEGWASVFNVVDHQDDIVAPGAFKRTIEHMRQSGRVVTLTKGHDMDNTGVIGSLVFAQETAYGLRIKARYASTPTAQEQRTLAKEGHIKGMSIFGPILSKSETMVAGKPVRVLKEVGLMAVALTPYPANELALSTAAKGAMAVHHSTMVDQAWDAGAEVGKANTEAEYRHMFAVLRTGADPANKGSYNLPHHTAGTNSPAVVSAVRNALARLGQTEGLSDAERESARAHLQAHLDDFNKSSSLDPRWEEDLRSALRISSAPVRAVAIAQLIKARYPDDAQVPATDAGAGVSDDVSSKTTEQEMGDAANYALSLIGEPPGPGPSGPPGDDAKSSLVDLEAFAAAEKTSAEIDALHAELRGGQ